MARGALLVTAMILACVTCVRSRREEWRPRETNEATIAPPYRPRPPSTPLPPPEELRDPLVDYFVPRVAEALARRAASGGDAGLSVDASSDASAPTLGTLRGLTPRALVQGCRRQHVEPREMPASMLHWTYDEGLRDLVYGGAARSLWDWPLGLPNEPWVKCEQIAVRFQIFLRDCGEHEAHANQLTGSGSSSFLISLRNNLVHHAHELRAFLRRPEVEAAANAYPGAWCERLRAWILLLSEEPDALDHLRAGVASPLFRGSALSLLLLAERDDRASASLRAEWYARVAADTELDTWWRAYALYRLAWWTRGPAAAEHLTRAAALLDAVDRGWVGVHLSTLLARDACAIVRDAPRSER